MGNLFAENTRLAHLNAFAALLENPWHPILQRECPRLGVQFAENILLAHPIVYARSTRFCPT
jgi:hypothetical protein